MFADGTFLDDKLSKPHFKKVILIIFNFIFINNTLEHYN